MALITVTNTTEQDSANRELLKYYRKTLRQNQHVLVAAYGSVKQNVLASIGKTDFMRHIVTYLASKLKWSAEACNDEDFHKSIHAMLFAKSIDKATGRSKGIIPRLASYTLEKIGDDPENLRSEISYWRDSISQQRKLIEELKTDGSEGQQKALAKFDAEPTNRTSKVRLEMYVRDLEYKINQFDQKISELETQITASEVNYGQYWTPNPDSNSGATIIPKNFDIGMGTIGGTLSMDDFDDLAIFEEPEEDELEEDFENEDQ